MAGNDDYEQAEAYAKHLETDELARKKLERALVDAVIKTAVGSGSDSKSGYRFTDKQVGISPVKPKEGGSSPMEDEELEIASTGTKHHIIFALNVWLPRRH